jgi:O-acetyl-ADP-ribose deacetylase (regulator of RNase III)
MKIVYINGDLFKTDIKLIVHGCNNMGVMDSGVAAIVKREYPKAFKEYNTKYILSGFQGGDIICVNDNNKIICNMITQNFYGRDGKRYAKYDWIAEGFYNLNNYCLNNDINEIAMPLIGAGLGGGDWNVISAIIESECNNITPFVYKI